MFDPSAPPEPAVDKMAKIQAVLSRFEISIAEADDLVALEDYEIVIIADDSGSMGNSAEPPHMRRLGAPKKTRWMELTETCAEIVEIAACFDESGIDLFFLNRGPVLEVTHAEDPRFREAFRKPPGGGTPLTETLKRVVKKVS